MNLLFCENIIDTKVVDFDYEDEYASAIANGFHTFLFSFEILTKAKNGESAIKKIKPSDNIQAIIYRGWMLKPSDYELLYKALAAKNYLLINTPQQYQNCHYFPDSYPYIKKYTPKTVWVKLDGRRVDYNSVYKVIEPFADSPLILKDFVKSQKYYWKEACYIPSAQDTAKVKAVVDRFVELQGDDLNEGLVFREFMPLKDLALHSKSNMPLPQEYRLFFLYGQLIGCFPYWEEGEYFVNEELPLEWCTQIAKGVNSNFFSMDIAKTKDNNWIIVELGDGQVAGLPDKADKDSFYRSFISLLHTIPTNT